MPDAATRRPLTIGWLAGASVVVALATGLLQAAWLAWRLLVRHELIWRPRDFPWMAPLSYLPAVALAALVAVAAIVVLRRLRPGRDERRIAAGALLFVGALALALYLTRVHPAAQALLALGVAVQASAMLARRSTRSLGRAALLLAVVVAALGVGGRAWRGWTERRALAALPPAPAGAPNVLLIILDTVRAASLSFQGYARPTTPKLERWASEGVTFDWAFAPAPWTLPSHGSLFTGHRATELSTGLRTPLDATLPTVAEAFRDRGWATAGFVANMYYAGHDSGLDRGFIHYQDYRATLTQLLWSSTLAQTELVKSLVWSWTWRDVARALLSFDLTTEPLRFAQRKAASDVTDPFLAWQARQGARPWFAFLNYFDAHAAYLPPGEYRKLFSPTPSQLDLYESCIRYLDDDIDRLLTAQRDRGVLDNTIVVVSSDHGEYFGEYGKTGHGNGLHPPVIHVPLVIRYPASAPAGARVASAVSLRDIPATLTDLAGITDARFPGLSLAARWSGDAPAEGGPVLADISGPHGVPEEERAWHALVTDDLLWIRSSDGREELYAYREDPGAAPNLLAVAERDPRLRARRDSLQALWEGASR